jgi:malate dehydrogenase
MRKKISVIGSGAVGSACAQRLSERGYADIMVVDIIPGMPQGKALDILQATPILGSDVLLVGSNNYEETANSDILVVTAGAARKPGMSRDDLLFTNMNIVRDIIQKAIAFSPDCIILMVTNPLDAMTQLAYEISGFPRNRVVGQSGILDTARFRTFIAQELNVSVEDVQALVLGGHGDQMVPLPRLATVGGIPISRFLSPEVINKIVDRTIKGGGEIVSLLGTSAYYAPSAAVVQMVDAILLDKKRILPCSVYLDGEYGIKGVFAGVPIKLGAKGVEEIIEIELMAEEREALHRSAQAVKELVEKMRQKLEAK